MPDTKEDIGFAQLLVQKFHTELAEFAANAPQLNTLLYASEFNGLALCDPESDPKARLTIAFHEGASAHRRQFGGGKSQMIAKAVGIERGIFPSVLDATAGLGGDAFVLASLGSKVVAFERSLVLSLLLQDAKNRALQWAELNDPELLEVLSRLEFCQGDAIEQMRYLQSSSSETRPQVIYLDPMFPERKKSASVKKEMKILQKLLQHDPQDESELLDVALDTATHRVVAKRPRHAPAIEGSKPQYSLEGKSTRFDIYPLKSLKASSVSNS